MGALEVKVSLLQLCFHNLDYDLYCTCTTSQVQYTAFFNCLLLHAVRRRELLTFVSVYTAG